MKILRRFIVNRKRIVNDVKHRVGDFYSDKQVEEITNAVLQSLVDSYTRGDVVDFGVGRTYLKLRKNNTKFSPEKPYSIVFRGDVNQDFKFTLIDSALSDSKLFEMLYSRRGVTEESE